jgi:hypothetical protein
MSCYRHVVIIGLSALLATTSATFAQQADPQGGSTAVPAQAAPPPPPPDSGDGFIDKGKEWAEDHQIVQRLNGDVDGWYPRLGGMTRGGGFALGPGYRFHVGTVLVDLSAGLSTKFYKAADVKVRWLQAFDERVELWTNYRFEDFPQEDFFGIGSDSSESARTSYDFDSSDVTIEGRARVLSWLRTGVIFGFMSPEIGPGTDSNFPSLEQVFTDGQAPGLIEQPNFLHTTLYADVDYRDQRGHPRSGGFYHAAFSVWDDQTLDRFDFRRFDLNASQYVPLVAGKQHMVMGRVGVSYVNNETGQRVPFYFLPYVGGVDTIRSFREFRFKDENALWMTAEYNWAPIKYVSVAAFIDTGKVGANWQDIDLNDMKKGYGFGIRAHTRTQTFARFDIGTGGGEGWHTFLKLGAAF